MDFNNVKAISIGNDDVKGIRDKNGTLLWSKEVYTVQYSGDTTQNGTPTPSDPQTVNTVTGRQVVTVSGKNLYNPNNILENKYLGGGGVWYTDNNMAYNNFEIPVSPSSSITVSFSNRVGAAVRIGEYNSSGTFLDRIVYNSTSPQTLTVSNTTTKLVFSIEQSTTKYFTDLQIEKGATATPYQAPQSYEVNLGKNLCSSVGSPSDNARQMFIANQSNFPKTFTLSFDCPALATTPNTVTVLLYNTVGATAVNLGSLDIASNQRITKTITLTDAQWKDLAYTTGGWIQLYKTGVWSGATTFENAQIEAGASATSYAPYISHFGKNMLNLNNKIENSNIDSSGTVISSIYNLYYTKVTAGSTYTISDGATSSSRQYVYGFYSTIPTIGSAGNARVVTQGVSVTFTVPEGYNYIALREMSSSEEPATKVQIEAGSTATSYQPFIGGQLELCKIGTYQDYIYKSGDDWYVHKETEKAIFDETGNWMLNANYTNNTRFTYQDIVTNSSANNVFSDYFIKGTAGEDTPNIDINGTSHRIMITIPNSIATTTTQLTSWLSSNNVTVYYILATPTDIQITDSSVVAQLNAVNNILVKYGYQSSISGNLPLVINKTSI